MASLGIGTMPKTKKIPYLQSCEKVRALIDTYLEASKRTAETRFPEAEGVDQLRYQRAMLIELCKQFVSTHEKVARVYSLRMGNVVPLTMTVYSCMRRQNRDPSYKLSKPETAAVSLWTLYEALDVLNARINAHSQ